MSISFGNQALAEVHKNNLTINEVYKGNQLVYSGKKVYSYVIHQNVADPYARVEYTESTKGMKPCKMNFDTDKFDWGDWKDAFFIPKPCALRYDGTVAYYLDPNDFTKKADGTPSDVADSSFGGNFMVEFPKIFVKTENSGDDLIIHVADKQEDETFECWSCKRADGTYNEHFYLPMFRGAIIGGKIRSIGNDVRPWGDKTAEDEATLAVANGKGWNTTLWCDEVLMWILFPLLFKSTNSQKALGRSSRGDPEYTNVRYPSRNNTLLTKGLMYGTKESSVGVVYLGLKSWYGDGLRRVNGLIRTQKMYKVKMTYSTIDGSSTIGFNRTGSGYKNLSPYKQFNDYLTKITAAGIGNLMPIEAINGSYSTYYCADFSAYWDNNDTYGIAIGGDIYQPSSGIFSFGADSLVSYKTPSMGASLSFHEGWG